MKEVPFRDQDPMALFRKDSIFASLTEAVQSVQNSTAPTAGEKTAILDPNPEQLLTSVGVLA